MAELKLEKASRDTAIGALQAELTQLKVLVEKALGTGENSVGKSAASIMERPGPSNRQPRPLIVDPGSRSGVDRLLLLLFEPESEAADRSADELLRFIAGDAGAAQGLREAVRRREDISAEHKEQLLELVDHLEESVGELQGSNRSKTLTLTLTQRPLSARHRDAALADAQKAARNAGDARCGR